MNQHTITVSSYGLFCLSISVLDDFLREHKIKSKKVAAFLNKNKNILEDAMMTGSLLPISVINSIDYAVQVVEGHHTFNSEWVEVLTIANCHLQVGDDAAVWVGSMGAIDDWNSALYEGKKSIQSETLDGEILCKAYRFAIRKGLYNVTLRGFKKTHKMAYPAVNFGFAYELHSVEKFLEFTNPLVQNLNIAKM